MFAWIKFLKDDIHTHFAMLISTVLLRFTTHLPNLLMQAWQNIFHYNFFEPMPYFYLVSEVIRKPGGFMKTNRKFSENGKANTAKFN